MNKTPTAKEFFNQWDEISEDTFNWELMMIEFTKLHVKAALEAAHRNMQLPEEDLEFTLNAYPENLIQ